MASDPSWRNWRLTCSEDRWPTALAMGSEVSVTESKRAGGQAGESGRSLGRFPHLPRPGQNLVYILALAVSPLLNLFVQGRLAADFAASPTAEKLLLMWPSFQLKAWSTSTTASLSGAHGLVLSVALMALLILMLRTCVHRVPHVRRMLWVFGLACSLDLLINIAFLTAAVYHLKLASYQLLLEAIVFYVSLNLVFLFWYWYVDFPRQLRSRARGDLRPEIRFPEQSETPTAGWLPRPVDYLFFTTLSCNTLGPPEGHAVIGTRVKWLEMAHTATALIVFLILVARAINTLD
ncbi:MAG: hypothetical protein WCH37_03440 [Synechococcaceae cyanobacterium ELA182]